jgi:uncharacterized protein RhaS with RHS repeats
VKNGVTGKPLDISYAYEALSQLVAVQEHLAGPDRLVKNAEYSYDAVGNLLSRTTELSGNGHTIGMRLRTQYAYNEADQLLQAGATTYTYDANGNRVVKADPVKGRIAYGYDPVDRLISVRGSGTEVAYM